ncbi:MAG: hypothetical protein IPN27_07885 [Cellvibrionales bacterium]|nr:hypothetical protein [Cellvibrionales bacterium]
MDLKDFVKESLVQISYGINDANIELSGTGAIINPLNVIVNSENSQAYGRTGQPHSHHENSRVVERVEFDVAVVAEQGEQTNGGIKLAIAAIGLGVGGQSDKSNRSESRIKFTIPVVFPGVESRNT